MTECGSLSVVPMIDFFASGVRTCSIVSCAVQPSVRSKYAIALRRSIFLMRSARMCSCSKPSVWPASCRTTRWNSASEVRIVKPSRLKVGWSSSIPSISVPTYDQYPAMSSGSSSRAMRTCPMFAVSTNCTFVVLAQAFMCSRMRARRSRAGLSRNWTVSRTPVEGHLCPITTASRRGPPRRPTGVRARMRWSSAFSGLISTLRRRTLAACSGVRARGLQTILDMGFDGRRGWAKSDHLPISSV